MAFADMWFEIAGELNVPEPLARTKLNEALGQIYDDEEQQLWSFQLKQGAFLTPGLQFASGWPGGWKRGNNGWMVSDGMIFARPFSDEIKGDERAARAWRKHKPRPFLTEMQIRSPFFSLYDIIHFDGIDTLIIDRPWMEPEPWGIWGPPWHPDFEFDEEHEHSQPYMIYQAYFPTPVEDFKRFFEIRDTMMSGLIDYWSYNQKDLTRRDPQRIVFDLPAYAVFFDWDHRGQGTEFESATFGFPRYELWPHPLSEMPYTFSYQRRGPLLEHPHDTLPRPLTEDMLKWRTREALYLWKEAQKGETIQRGSGADWKFLAQSAAAEYKAARNRIGKVDVALVDLFFTRFQRMPAERQAPFATVNMQLNVGGW
jgi:hypothetical protein